MGSGLSHKKKPTDFTERWKKEKSGKGGKKRNARKHSRSKTKSGLERGACRIYEESVKKKTTGMKRNDQGDTDSTTLCQPK